MLSGLICVSLGVLEQAVRESWSSGMWEWPPKWRLGSRPQDWSYHGDEINGYMMVVWKPCSCLSALSESSFLQSGWLRAVESGYLTREQQPQLPALPSFCTVCCFPFSVVTWGEDKDPLVWWGVWLKLAHFVVAASGFAVTKHCVLNLAGQARYRTR